MAAWTITTQLHTGPPGVTQVDITGPANTDVVVWRRGIPGAGQYIEPRQRVRGALNTGGGLLSFLDPEAQLDEQVFYEVEVGGTLVASSDPVFVPGVRGALIRSVEAPMLLWQVATVYEETNIERRVTSDVFRILGRRDPVVVSDVPQLESGTLVFLADDIHHADLIIEVLQPGAPVLYRTDCGTKTRDKVIAVTGPVQDVIVDKRGRRRFLTVPYTAISWPDDRPQPPQAPGTWTYADLDKPTTTAPTYADLGAARATYLELAQNPISP